MTQKNNVKNEVNLYKFEEFKFNDKKNFIKNTFNLKEIYLTIVELN